MILGYIRVSTDKQNLKNQKSEILNYAQKNKIMIDDFIEVEISSKKNMKERLITKLLEKLKNDDMLIVTELSRIGRSLKEILTIIEQFIENGISIHFIKQNLIINSSNQNDMVSKVMLTMFGLFAELERDLIGQRTKEALKARKAQGITLGRPRNILQKSVFDKDIDRILELLMLGLNLKKISEKHLKYGTYNVLRQWFKKRFIRKGDTIIKNEVFSKFYEDNKDYFEEIQKD